MTRDHYNTLQIPTHATLPEIKQAYHRLAMIYHPDKNQNDPYAINQFNDIKEAYEILTNPVKKEIYLQERWYDQSIGKKRTGMVITPVTILKLSLELEKYVSKLDIHRMNQTGLFHYVNELLSDDTIEKLKQFGEKGVNRQVINTLLIVIKPLSFQFVKSLSTRFGKLAGNDEIVLQQINDFLVRYRKNLLWNKFKIPFIIILTILICLLIYLTGK